MLPIDAPCSRARNLPVPCTLACLLLLADDGLHDGGCLLHVSESRFFWFGNMLERTPDQMWPAAANPRILEALEAIAGPFIQIDNFTLAAFPPLRPPTGSAAAAGAAASPPSTPTSAVSGWHRDRYSHLPRGHYEVPSGINAIWYLQDLTDEMGPLRVIPRSVRAAAHTQHTHSPPLHSALTHARPLLLLLAPPPPPPPAWVRVLGGASPVCWSRG